MEILEFLRQRKRMCDYYGDDTCVCEDSRGECPAIDIDCSFATEKPEQLVAVVEKWAKEHPEGTAAATNPKNNDPCVKTIQDGLEGAIYQTLKNYENRFAEIKSVEDLEENCYRNFQIIGNRHIETCKEIVRLKDRVAELEVALKAEPVPAPKPKRTNKDVLLAAFPDARMEDSGIPTVCPLSLCRHYNCSKFKNCDECGRAYWLAEVEE